METQIRIAGGLLLALAGLHGVFPRYFKWTESLKSLSLLDRQVMYIHTFFIAFTVALLGILCISSAPDLVHTVLGKRLCMGIGFFWTVRLFVQFWGYSSQLWRGKKMETRVHIVFSFLWTYLVILFFCVGLSH
jgi:hypothetical protein